MYSVILLLLALWATGPLEAEGLEFQADTVLIYESHSGIEKNSFVLRIARFHPDIVFEWESVSHQGTVHLFRRAVEEAESLTNSSLFDPGVDIESDDVMTKWLPQESYRELLEKGETRIKLNRLNATFKLEGRTTRTLLWDKEEVEVPVLEVVDSKGGKWTFLASERNPVQLGYETPYYREALTRVSTREKNVLRWFQRLPSVR